MPKWFHITISVLLALLAIGFSILICGKHHWGYIPCEHDSIVQYVEQINIQSVCRVEQIDGFPAAAIWFFIDTSRDTRSIWCKRSFC